MVVQNNEVDRKEANVTSERVKENTQLKTLSGKLEELMKSLSYIRLETNTLFRDVLCIQGRNIMKKGDENAIKYNEMDVEENLIKQKSKIELAAAEEQAKIKEINCIEASSNIDMNFKEEIKITKFLAFVNGIRFCNLTREYWNILGTSLGTYLESIFVARIAWLHCTGPLVPHGHNYSLRSFYMIHCYLSVAIPTYLHRNSLYLRFK